MTSVLQTLEGADAVVGLLHNEVPTAAPLAAELQNIVQGMQQAGVKRLLVCLDATTEALAPAAEPNGLWRNVLQWLKGQAKNGPAGALDIIRNSGLDWTIVHSSPPHDGPHAKAIRVGLLQEATNHAITHADLAKFMLSQVTTSEYLYKMPAVST